MSRHTETGRNRATILNGLIKLLLFGAILLAACNSPRTHEATPYKIGEVVYEESFQAADTTAWIVESEDEVDLSQCVSDGALTLKVPGGITVWNTTRFEGDVMFEFDATMVSAGGKHDRVSDLNCFWMATDPDFPGDFFARSAWRMGIFWRYYSLDLYYVGYGGHDNSMTRMRKYDASLAPPPPVMQEYTDSAHLITANKRNLIRIVCFESRVIYFFNGEKLFDIVDEHPYKEGYFGFRTTNSHMRIENFKVFSLGKTNAARAH